MGFLSITPEFKANRNRNYRTIKTCPSSKYLNIVQQFVVIDYNPPIPPTKTSMQEQLKRHPQPPLHPMSQPLPSLHYPRTSYDTS